MYIVIAGCGRMGALVGKGLSDEGHEVLMIDIQKEAFEKLGGDFSGSVLVGDCRDVEVLEAAQLYRADVVIGLTDKDTTNLKFVQHAKKEYNVKKIIAKIDELTTARVYKEELEIDTICTTQLVANQILTLLGVKKCI